MCYMYLKFRLSITLKIIWWQFHLEEELSVPAGDKPFPSQMC